ncbi:MAG: hypothetical protein WCJ02_10150 [bacterium]
MYKYAPSASFMITRITLIVFSFFITGCVLLKQSQPQFSTPFCELCDKKEYNHGFTDIPVYTGCWDFVTLEGKVFSGKWRHQGLTVHVHIGLDAPKIIENRKLSGVLFVWWDMEKMKTYTVSEYRKGKEEGYLCQMTYSGQLRNVAIMKNGYYDSWVWLRGLGGYSEIGFNLDDIVSITRIINFPEKGEKLPACMWPPYPEDGSPLISTITNNIPCVR